MTTNMNHDGDNNQNDGRREVVAVASLRSETREQRSPVRKSIRAVASFMVQTTDQDDAGSDDGGVEATFADEQADAEVSGVERLTKALTADTRNKGIFRYTTTLGHPKGMEPEVLVRVALEDEWQLVSCASLPFTLCFFAMFMVFFWYHYDVTSIFQAENPLRVNLGEPLVNLDKAVDLYDYLEYVYFPFLWAARPDTSFALKRESQSHYSELLAGVTLTTGRALEEPCPDDMLGHMRCFTEGLDELKGGRDDWVYGGAFDRRRLEEEASTLPRPPMRDLGLNDTRIDFLPGGRLLGAEAHARVRPRHGRRATGRRKNRRSLAKAQVGGAVSPRRRLVGEVLRPSPGLRIFKEQQRRLRVNRPELRKFNPTVLDGVRSRIYVPSSQNLTSVVNEVKRWYDGRLIRETTVTFSALAILYNRHLTRDLVTRAQLDVAVGRGGDIFTEVKILSVVLNPLSSDVVIVTTGSIWLICLLAFSCSLPSQLVLRYRQGRLFTYFFRFWNLMEWFIIVCGWCVLCMFALERRRVSAMKDYIDDFRSRRATIEILEDRQAIELETFAELNEKCIAATDLSAWVQMWVALYHIVLVLRFFLASRGQPRLAIVLITIRKAAIDLFHLLIVFLIIFIAFAISGHILFGRRNESFATFEGAFADCFQIVMEREYNWEKLTEQDLYTCTLWVWSFLLLVVLILINIFLAMIFDTYGDVRASVGHSPTLLQTSWIMITHFKHCFRCFSNDSSVWIPNGALVQGIRNMRAMYISPWMVKDAFPGISNRQVSYVFTLSKNRLESMLLRGNRQSMPAVTASILLAVDRMHKGLALMETSHMDFCAPTGPISEEDSSPLRAAARAELAKEGGSPERPPAQAPAWLKVQLEPHIQKQAILLNQVYLQVQRIEQSMRDRGLDQGIPPVPAKVLAPPPLEGMWSLPKHADFATNHPSSKTNKPIRKQANISPAMSQKVVHEVSIDSEDLDLRGSCSGRSSSRGSRQISGQSPRSPGLTCLPENAPGGIRNGDCWRAAIRV